MGRKMAMTTPSTLTAKKNKTKCSAESRSCVQFRYNTGRKRRGWPGGRHATPTELKMRSRITTFSVNFSAFPANQSFRTTAESMRPRAKSFIRSISQIEANRQKFSLSMTSEVRKCPKSAKSDRNSDVFARAVERRGKTALLDLTFIFEKNRFFFSLFNFRSWLLEAGTGRNSSDDHISAISAARRLKIARSSSDWPSAQPGMHDFFFACHHSELFRDTKKVKIQNCQIGLKFSNLANSVLRTRKSEKLKKKIFWCDVINFFFRIFFEMSICFDGNRSARYDLLLVDDENIELALKLGALGADKPPANNIQ